MSAEGNVKLATLVETAQAIEASAVQIIEKLRCFRRLRRAGADESIETIPAPVVARLVV